MTPFTDDELIDFVFGRQTERTADIAREAAVDEELARGVGPVGRQLPVRVGRAGVGPTVGVALDDDVVADLGELGRDGREDLARDLVRLSAADLEIGHVLGLGELDAQALLGELHVDGAEELLQLGPFARQGGEPMLDVLAEGLDRTGRCPGGP